MKPHFLPVGNPAPPRPRRPESTPASPAASGATASADLKPRSPPDASYSAREAARPRWKFLVRVGLNTLLLQYPVYPLRRQVAIQRFAHHHRGRDMARAEAYDRQERERAVVRRPAPLHAEPPLQLLDN